MRASQLTVTARSALAVVAAGLLISSSARAAGRDPARADRLFREGQARMSAGEYGKACHLLADSYGLDPTLGTLLNLAFCHEKEGRNFTAWLEYKRVEAEAARTEQADRARFARKRADEIGAKLPRAHIEPPSGSEVTEVLVDGEAVPEPRAREIVVTPGARTLEVVFSPGGRQTRQVSFPDKGGAVTVVSFADPSGGGSKPLEPEPEAGGDHDGPSGRTIAGLVIAGSGVVLLGVGTYFGIQTFSRKDEADEHCGPSGCDAQGKTLGEEAHTFATLSTIFVASGALATAAGLYFTFSSPSPQARTGATVSAWPGGIRLVGTF